MTTDELKALLAGATPGPWEAVLDVFWRVYVADGGDYAGQCVGDMNESAAMWRSPSDEQPDDFAEANARLIAMARDILAEVIVRREREARLVEALRPFSAMASEMFTANWNYDDVAIGFVTREGPLRLTFKEFCNAHTALAEIEKEAGE